MTSVGTTPEGVGDSPATLDDAAIDKLRRLVRLISELRQATSRCRRIQRGSPGAGSLSDSMANVKDRINQFKPQMESLMETNDECPGIRELRAQFVVFDTVLNEFINERGYDDGYTDRVCYLEKINYESGILKGRLETMISYSEHHRTHRQGQAAGQGDQRTMRRLTYDERIHRQGQAAGQGDRRTMRRLTYDEDENQPAVGPPTLAHDSLYSGGDVAVSVNLHRHACSQYSRLLQSEEHCDVVFRVSNQRIMAHRTVLAAQSEYFNHLLFGDMREARNNEEIKMRDVSLDCFRLLLQYAYTGCVDLQNAQLQGVLELIEAADRFYFIQLKNCLAEQLCQLIDVSSVLLILLYSDRLNLNEVERTCLQFIDRNAAAVLEEEDILTLPEMTLCRILSRDSFAVEEGSIYNTVLGWMEHNNVSEAQSLLDCVRLSEVPPEELIDFSQPLGRFTQGEVLDALRVQMKNEHHRMNPRGRIELDANLFADKDLAKVKGSVFWWQRLSSTPPIPTTTIAVPPLRGSNQVSFAFGNVAHFAPVNYSGVPNVPLTEAVIASPNSGGLTMRPGSLPAQPQFQCTVALDDIYLLNTVTFKSYPEVQDVDPISLGYSYIFEFSKDGRQWEKLFDYSKVSCYGANTLNFPKLATKYLKLQLVKVCNPGRQFSVTFTSCLLQNEVPPVLLRADGVIAPLQSINPTCNGSWRVGVLPAPGYYELKFHQPYSVTELSFRIENRWPANTIGDVTVAFGVEGEQLQKKTLSNRVLSDIIAVKFAEHVVNYFTVTVENRITPPHCGTESTGISAPSVLMHQQSGINASSASMGQLVSAVQGLTLGGNGQMQGPGQAQGTAIGGIHVSQVQQVTFGTAGPTRTSRSQGPSRRQQTTMFGPLGTTTPVLFGGGPALAQQPKPAGRSQVQGQQNIQVGAQTGARLSTPGHPQALGGGTIHAQGLGGGTIHSQALGGGTVHAQGAMGNPAPGPSIFPMGTGINPVPGLSVASNLQVTHAPPPAMIPATTITTSSGLRVSAAASAQGGHNQFSITMVSTHCQPS